jgi:hypothetical protein
MGVGRGLWMSCRDGVESPNASACRPDGGQGQQRTRIAARSSSPPHHSAAGAAASACGARGRPRPPPPRSRGRRRRPRRRRRWRWRGGGAPVCAAAAAVFLGGKTDVGQAAAGCVELFQFVKKRGFFRPSCQGSPARVTFSSSHQPHVGSTQSVTVRLSGWVFTWKVPTPKQEIARKMMTTGAAQNKKGMSGDRGQGKVPRARAGCN